MTMFFPYQEATTTAALEELDLSAIELLVLAFARAFRAEVPANVVTNVKPPRRTAKGGMRGR